MNLMKNGSLSMIAVVGVILLCFMYMFSSGYMMGSPVQTNISDAQFGNFPPMNRRMGSTVVATVTKKLAMRSFGG